MAGVGLVRHGMYLALDDELVIIEVAVIGGNTEIVAHILAAQALLAGHQRLKQLLAVTGADDICAGVAEQLLNGLGKIADGGRVSLLNEQVARVCVLEREHNKVDRLVKVHKEAGHIRVGDGDGAAGLDLVDKQRNYAAAAAHYVAVAGAADGRAAALGRYAGIGVDDVLHHRLGNAHSIDRISGLIGRKADHALDARVNGGVQHVIGADYVGLDRLHREELARRHLLESGRVKDVVDAGHSVANGLRVADIADVELHLLCSVRVLGLKLMTHIILLFLIARENADFLQVGVKKVL